MKDELKRIGTEAVLSIDGLHIHVRILDVRQAFGRIDYNVQPLAGSGTKWISKDRLLVSN